MANNDGSQKKCYTFIWKLENARYCWDKQVPSPVFEVGEIEKSKWRVEFVPSRMEGTNVAINLMRVNDGTLESVKIDSEIAFVEFNGAVLFSERCRNKTFDKSTRKISFSAKREDVFPKGRSSFNFRDTLIVRCKIWKSEGEISEDVQYIARTCISTQKRSFIWKHENFSNLESEKKYEYDIKSPEDNRRLMSLNLTIKRDNKIVLVAFPQDKEIQFYYSDLSVIDCNGNTIEDLRDEKWCYEPHQTKGECFSISKTKLTEKKNIYLPNDVLSVKCKCIMSFGITFEEIEETISDCTAFKKNEMSVVSDEHIMSVSKDVLNESFKSLLSDENESPLFKHMMNNLQKFVNNGDLSDIKLRTSSKRWYFANMFILSARSPVFKNMFSGEMSHVKNDYVDIENLEDDTLSRILQFIYNSEVEQLDWSSAIKLYKGAYTYKISDLKCECSSYLTTNLCQTNACEALQLADQYQDEALKRTVQNFILKKPKSIMGSEEFGKLMEKNPKLAAETMYLKFSKGEKKGKPPVCGNQKKRKQKEESKYNSRITDHFKKLKNTQGDMTSYSFKSQSPLDLPMEPDNQRELQKVDLIRKLSPSPSRSPSPSSAETDGTSDEE